MPQSHKQAYRRAHIVHDLIFFHRFSPAFQSRFPFASSYSEQIEEIDQQDDKLYRAQKYLKLRGSLPADEEEPIGTGKMASLLSRWFTHPHHFVPNSPDEVSLY